MGLFDRFKRNDSTNQEYQSETDTYYPEDNAPSRGVAFLVAVTALALTLLVAAALYFGGRFVYRQFASNDQPSTVEQERNDAGEPAENVEQRPEGQNEENNDRDNKRSNSSSSSSSENRSSTTSPPSSNTNNTNSTPSTGDQALPRTGDEGM